ncbi:MAG TPA: 50S ribosomal protein L29 [Candidatus Saccharimonadia bacterium]
MKLADITKLTTKELADLLKTERAALAQAVIDSRTKEVKNVKTINGHKKTIARALTISRERELSQSQEEAK